MSDENRMLTKEELAAEVQLSRWTLQRHVKAGKLRAFKFGTEVRFRRHDVEQWLRECRVVVGRGVRRGRKS